MRQLNRNLLALGVGAVLWFIGQGVAEAAGLYFSERGVRPLARGGAFVAGANDLGAMWYNPAGIYDAKSQFLFDATWLNYSNDYTRRSLLKQRDPNTNAVVAEYEQTYSTVTGTSPVVPIPTLAGSYQIHRDWVLALGVFAPNAAIASYPEVLGKEAAPQRYSLITLEGSALLLAGVWAAYAPNDDWRIGAGFQVMAGRFVNTTMLSACIPDRFLCAPEQAEWDSLQQLTVGPIVAPTGNVGVTWTGHPRWRVGAAFQLPIFVRSTGELRSRFPTTPAFDNVVQEGNEVDVAFDLPWSLRAGVQFKPFDELAVEASFEMNGWSMHDSISIQPTNISLLNAVGFPNPYSAPGQEIPRNFQDTYSARLGGEGAFEAGPVTLAPRLGASYESSAVPAKYLSALTVDGNKLTLGAGIGVHYKSWRFDVTYARVFMQGTDVAVDEAGLPLLSPLETNSKDPTYVNAGLYEPSINVLGVGLAYQFGSDPSPEKKQGQSK